MISAADADFLDRAQIRAMLRLGAPFEPFISSLPDRAARRRELIAEAKAAAPAAAACKGEQVHANRIG